MAHLAFIFSAFLLACLSVIPTLQAQNTVITLTAPESIADAMALQSRLDVITNNILDCSREENGDAQTCACALPKDMQSLKEAYQRAIQKHPDWEDASISFPTPSHNAAAQTTIDLANLDRQFDVCLPQPAP